MITWHNSPNGTLFNFWMNLTSAPVYGGPNSVVPYLLHVLGSLHHEMHKHLLVQVGVLHTAVKSFDHSFHHGHMFEEKQVHFSGKIKKYVQTIPALMKSYIPGERANSHKQNVVIEGYILE